MIEATQNYRKEMDNIELFLEECCVIQPGVRTTAKALYEAYTGWCQKNEEQILSQTRLGERLTKRGLEKKRSTGGIALLNREGIISHLAPHDFWAKPAIHVFNYTI